jgi:hypothetical protein
MAFFQPRYFSRNKRGVGLAAAVIAIYGRMRIGGLTKWLIKQAFDISMQGAVIAFERQNVITLLLGNFLSDVSLAI